MGSMGVEGAGAPPAPLAPPLAINTGSTMETKVLIINTN